MTRPHHGEPFGEALKRHGENELMQKLIDAELILSASDEDPDPERPRFVVDPDILRGMRYREDLELIVGNHVVLARPEIFSRDAIPMNVREIPSWLEELIEGDAGDQSAPASDPDQATAVDAGFSHDPGYRHVGLGGLEFALTQTQAEIVEVLHQAELSGQAWVSLRELRDKVRFKSEKLSQIFRRVQNPHWSRLIESDGHGFYRLRLAPDHGRAEP